MDARPVSGPLRKLAALWALGGVLGLLAQALLRLTPIAWEPIRAESLSVPLWALVIVWTIANAYFEGYRGFHLSFVPRVVRRTEKLLDEPTALRIALAPLYAVGYFDATPREKRLAWGVTLLVWIAIFVVRTLPQPWRGIIDAGVVSGLFFGSLSLIAQGARLFFVDLSPEAAPESPLS